jgi:transposase
VQLNSLIKKLLKVKDIVVEAVHFENVNGQEKLIVSARMPKRKRCRCGICGKKAKPYDRGRGTRVWRSLDFGSIEVWIEAESPRVCCREHGVVTAQVSWARHDAGFTYDFEETVTWLALHCSKSVVSVMMRIAWNTVGAIITRVHNDIKKQGGNRYDGLRCIGIDETSYKKGHKYMTVVVDHESGHLIWAAPGFGKTIVDKFFAEMSEKQRKSIRHVTADGARWIAESVSQWCPNAERSIDPFHVVQWVTDTLDEVRRVLWREAREAVKAGKKKRGRGRPKKGEEPKKNNKADELKGARYVFIKNPENLTPSQQATAELLMKSNPVLYRAYLLKEKIRLVFQHPLEEAKNELTDWIQWARRCRIPQFVELQKKITRHLDAILSSIKYGLSNARIEAINNKIKLTIRMAYGFRNIDNMIALVMLRCSGIDLNLPGRA